MAQYDLILKGGRIIDPAQGIDASILSLDEGAFKYEDVEGEAVTGNLKINATGVVLGGK